MTNQNKYSTSVYWSDEDEGYIAVVPEFPGLSAFGETKGEAIREATDATDGFIETYKEQGKKLPEIRKIHTHSGNIKIRISRSLHTALSLAAEHEGISLNSLIMSILSTWIGKQQYLEATINKISLNILLGIEKTKQIYSNEQTYKPETFGNNFILQTKSMQSIAY